MGRPMPDGSPALLKTREHLRRDDIRSLLKELVRKDWEKVPAVWGPESQEP